MAKETKIGLALCVLLIGAFAFVVYSKMNKQNGQDQGFVAASDSDTDTSSDDAPTPEDDAQGGFGGEPGHNHDHGNEFANDRQSKFDEFDVPPRRGQSRRSDFEQISDLKEDHQRRHGADTWESSQSSQTTRQDDPFAQASRSRAQHAGHQHEVEGDEPDFGFDESDPNDSRTEESPEKKSWNLADFLGGRNNDETGQQQQLTEDDEEEPFGLEPAEPTYRREQRQDGEYNPFAETDQSAGRAAVDNHQHNHSNEFGSEQDLDDWSSERFGGNAETRQSASTNWDSTTRVERSNDFGSFDEPQQFDDENGSFSDDEFGNLGPAPEPGQTQQDDPFGRRETYVNDATNDFSQPFGKENDQSFGQADQGTRDHLFPETVEEPATVGGDRPTVYVVRQGDMFWNISKKQYGAGRYYKALASYNQSRIPDPRRLRIGMKVLVPTIQSLEARFPSLCPWRTAKKVGGIAVVGSDSSAGYFTNADGTPLYRVGAEDTLTAIAKNHLGRASRWVQVYALNRDSISDPAKLKIGTVLQLPADASRVQLVRRSQSFR